MDQYVFPEKVRKPTNRLRPSDEGKSEELLQLEEEQRKAQVEENRHKQMLQELKRQRREQLAPTVKSTEPPEEALLIDFKLPVQPKDPRVLQVAVVGLPNAGKSTLVNRIVGTKVSAVSTKHQTTREAVIGVATTDNAQIIFTDTPGIVDRKIQKKVRRDLVVAAWDSMDRADLVMVMVDCVKKIDPHLLYVMNELARIQQDTARVNKPPIVLVLNKVDLYEEIEADKRKPLLARFERFVPELSKIFSNVFALSALSGKNVTQLQDFLFSQAKPSPWIYHKDMKTLQSELQIAEEIIREKLYKRLNEETPYLLKLENKGWTKHPDGTLEIVERIWVPHVNYLKQVTGTSGDVLYAIMIAAKEDLEVEFKCQIDLKLTVKVKEDMHRFHKEDL